MNAKDRKYFEEAQAWPIGTPVILTRDCGEKEETKTRSEPWLLRHGEAVIKVEGIVGGYLLSRIERRK